MAFQDIGRTAETTYFYRQLAVNSGGSTPGPSISAMTFPLAPDAPLAPSLTVVSATEIDVAQPALPARASSLSLQRSPDNATWTTIATGLQPG